MTNPNHYVPFLLLCLITFFAACKGGNTIDLGSGDDELSAELTDSIKVIASTLLLDSLPTSATGLILLGEVNDADFGKMNVSSYLQMKTDFTNPSLPEDARFDSLNLVLKYSGYAYGDTLISQHLMVNRLDERITLRAVSGGIEDEERPVFVSGEALYSTSTFKHEAIAIGEKDFKPRPKGGDSIVVKLNSAWGAEMFRMIVNKDSRIINTEEFQDYFKGFVIRSAGGKSITGLKADSVKMQLFYSYMGTDGMQKSAKLGYSLNSAAYQFNHIETDRSNTKLSGLSYAQPEIKSELTGQQLFIQGGTGLVTKLQLPGLLEFLKEPRVVINKLQLIIETRPDTYSVFKAPSSLILFIANASNTPKAIVQTPFVESAQQAYFQQGNEAGSSGRYVFELGEYANDLRKGLYKNTSLLLSLPVNNLMNSLDRLHVKGSSAVSVSVKTKIIYTKY